MRPRRRRGLVLLSLGLASGGLAASQVRERERRVEATVGPPVQVVVAKREIPADEVLRREDLGVERVPARFVPPDALGAADDLAGVRTLVPVPAGGYLTAGLLEGPAAAGARGVLRPGERALELAVGGGGGALAAAAPGARVDVLVSTRAHAGGGRTVVALEDVELLGVRPAAGASGLGDVDATGMAERAEPTAFATLRVTARQAVYLTAADGFALEVRLLLRPPGDRRRTGAVAVTEGEL